VNEVIENVAFDCAIILYCSVNYPFIYNGDFAKHKTCILKLDLRDACYICHGKFLHYARFGTVALMVKPYEVNKDYAKNCSQKSGALRCSAVKRCTEAFKIVFNSFAVEFCFWKSCYCTCIATRVAESQRAGGFWVESDSQQHWESDLFVRLRMSSCIIFYITLLNWEFVLKWYNFFWNFCWNRDFLLCTTISIDFNSQITFPLC